MSKAKPALSSVESVGARSERALFIATGGAGQVYRETTNPRSTTGDGLALAYRAGVEIADVEFVQFHPTTLYVAGAERMLVSEAVRGEGAYLVDRAGARFMTDRHPLGELRQGEELLVFQHARYLPRVGGIVARSVLPRR